MKAVSWNPEILIARRDGMQSSLANVIAVVRANRGTTIRMERSDLRLSERSGACIAASKEQFRVGCIKAVELGMQPLPERARVIAEIHRRIDRAMEFADASGEWQSRLAPILDFAGAWALAARLVRAGLRVSVQEEECKGLSSMGKGEGKADVQVVIPTARNSRQTQGLAR